MNRLTKWTSAYLVASSIWLILYQVLLSVELFRENLCVDCPDPEGFDRIDWWLEGALNRLYVAWFGLVACCLVLLVVLIAIQRRGNLPLGRISLAYCAGTACLLLGVGSVFVFVPPGDHLMTLPEKIKAIGAAGLADLLLAAIALGVYRRLGKAQSLSR